MNPEIILAYAKLNARIMPTLRGDKYETPLGEALEASGFGEVGGGGTMQLKTGEIEYCGIDVDLFDVDRGAPFVCKFLSERGAPRGSALSYKIDGSKVEMPFGTVEGIAIYLNGTDLPEDVYQQCDSNVVIEMLAQFIKPEGSIQGYWQGPSETALYLYGRSGKKIRDAIAGFMAEYPLCQRARIETIA